MFNFFINLILISLSGIVIASDGFFSDFSKVFKFKSVLSKDDKNPFKRLYALLDQRDDVIKSNFINDLLDKGPVPLQDRGFIINGWRWHTASVIRDLNRFELVIKECQHSNLPATEAIKRLEECYNFAIGFNWKGCMRVERELFFPWLQTLLPKELNYLFTDLYYKHDNIKKLSTELKYQCSIIDTDINAYMRATLLLGDLKDIALFIQNVQVNTFIPYISAYVNKREQEAFNNRVINRLGLLDSQIHLVSMIEAIKGDRKEEELFKKQIPFIVRKLLPVWRTNFYRPKSVCLEIRS